jgi:hypothetical protein
MDRIIFIGTVPPCPRCQLLTEIVTVKRPGFTADRSVAVGIEKTRKRDLKYTKGNIG